MEHVIVSCAIPSCLSGDTRVLNSDYTLSTFVNDCTNSEAYSIAREIIDGRRREGLVFFHGPASVGKTHLLHGIAHELAAQQGILRRKTAEEFTNAYRIAARAEDLDRFRRGVERIDRLLIDDVHLFRTRKQALGEFLHACHQFQRCGKLMVVAGRRSPAEFQVSEAMTNVLSAAVVCEIEPPGPEAKVEIIQSRLEAENLGELPGDIARYLANAADYTIAQLIGVARKVLLRCSITKETPTVQLAKQLLNECTKLTNFDGILLCVCRHFEIKNTAILLENRENRYSRGRELVAYLAAEAGIPKRQIASRMQISPSKLCRMIAQLDKAAQTDAALGDLVLRLADEIDS